MASIVIYYTRDGHTEKAAKTIAEEIGADTLKIEEKTNRKGFVGYLRAGFDAVRRKKAILKRLNEDLSRYDTVIFGSPIWGWKPTPAILTYIDSSDLHKKKVANFVTMGGSCGNSLQIMAEQAKKRGGKIVGSASMITGQGKQYLKEAKKFACEIKKI